MKLLYIFLLIYVLHDLVAGKSIQKRSCGECQTGSCQNCISSNNCNSCRQDCPSCRQECSSCRQECSSCRQECSSCRQDCNNCKDESCKSSNNCKERCSDECGDDKVPVIIPFPVPSASNGTPIVVHGSNVSSVNSYNFTADISLTNTINNINNISVPINFNSTIENHITFLPPPPVNNSHTEPCCIVVYPRTCDAVNGCYTRSHRECSSICTTSVVIITETPPIDPPRPTPCTNVACPTQPPTTPCPTQPPITPCPTQPPTTPCPTQPPITPCPTSNPYPVPCLVPAPQPPAPQPPAPQPPAPQPPAPPPPQPPAPCPYSNTNTYYQQWVPPQQPYINTGYQSYFPPTGCQGTYPYFSCGQQQYGNSINCSGCYYCNGSYNPQCATGPTCPAPCRRSWY